jgi:hypothetical protein
MTQEEAAELVLKNDPWTKCPREDDENHSEACECENSGAVLKPEYKEAYRVLGRPQPPIWKRRQMSNGEYHVSGPTVFVGKFPLRQRLIRIGSPAEPISQIASYRGSGSTKDPQTDEKEE